MRIPLKISQYSHIIYPQHTGLRFVFVAGRSGRMGSTALGKFPLFFRMSYTSAPQQPVDPEEEEETLLQYTQSEDLAPVSEEEERELLNEEHPETVIDMRGPRVMENDGVFSNMSAKPAQGKTYEEIEPPSYHDAIIDPAPDYFVSCVDEDGQVLIEGFDV